MIIRQRVRALLTLTMVSLSVLATSCSDQDKIYFTMVAQMHTRRLEAEAAVKYIKRTYKPQDDLYAQAQERYVTAYAMNHGAISAAKVAVAAEKSLKSVFAIEVSNADLAASEFLAFCAQVRPSSPTRGLLTHMTSSVEQFLRANPSVKVKLRERAVALVEKEAKWRSWDEIQL